MSLVIGLKHELKLRLTPRLARSKLHLALFFPNCLQPLTNVALCIIATINILEPIMHLVLSSNILYPYLIDSHYFTDNKLSVKSSGLGPDGLVWV
jgi:hypothetical protein